VGHAALLLIEALRSHGAAAIEWSELVRHLEELASAHRRRWAKDLVAAPERLARQVVELLVELRLAERVEMPAAAAEDGNASASASASASTSDRSGIRLLPAAARFLCTRRDEPEPRAEPEGQAAFW